MLGDNGIRTRRRARLLAIGVLSASQLVGCAAGNIGSTELALPVLSVKWLPPCSTGVAEPYFSLDVFADGALRYLGGAQAREVGERRAEIGRRQVRQLLGAAADAQSRSTEPPSPSRASERVAYCVEVAQGGESNLLFRGGGDEAWMQPFIGTIENTVDEKRWVCPERYPREEWAHVLYQSRYCGGYVARAALTFSIDESRCTSLAGRVYEGLIYYKRLYKSDSGTFVVADEGYRNAGGAEFAELIEAARRSDLAKSGIEEPNPRVDQDYFGGTSADLSRLKEILTRLLGFETMTPLSPSGCVSAGVSGSITLRYELGPPLRGE
jgi:hypothetical protein